MSKMRGFTLLEVLVTIALLAILVAVAVPSFQDMIERNQVTAAANDMVASLLTARSEAVKQERTTTMAKDGNWSKGWTVKDADDSMIVEYTTTHNDLSVSGHGSIANSISYSPSGRAVGGLTENTDYFKITMGDKVSCIKFSTTGRPAVGGCP